MKTSQSVPNPADFKPKPLTIEQENVIDLLILGKSERETADACRVSRTTIAEWRKSPLFVATLNQRRQALWQEAHERLRALIHKGLAKLETRIDELSTREILSLVGMARDLGEPTGETDVAKVAERMCLEALAKEGMKANAELDRLAKNLIPTDPAFERRKREIEAELRERYGENRG
jgi:hypothetical protein